MWFTFVRAHQRINARKKLTNNSNEIEFIDAKKSLKILTNAKYLCYYFFDVFRWYAIALRFSRKLTRFCNMRWIFKGNFFEKKLTPRIYMYSTWDCVIRSSVHTFIYDFEKKWSHKMMHTAEKNELKNDNGQRARRKNWCMFVNIDENDGVILV